MTYLFDDAIRYENSPNVDAFGRLRTSTPFTLFDSFHRFQDNGKIAEYTSGTASSTYDTNSSTIVMNVNTASGDKIYRESTRVFAYQPGKSLLTMQTFCMGTAKAGLRQRIGYFDVNNGVFLEMDGTTVNLVRRTSVSGVVQELRIPQSQWNVDKMDGSKNSTNPSGYTLDLTKTQIFYNDFEWLGVGTIRCGFVIEGNFVDVHKFHHANQPSATAADTTLPYIQTACLPIRAELENTSGTASVSSFRLICSTVISEGGYELRGKPRSAFNSITSPVSMATAGTIYPLVSIRLKSTRLNGIAIPVNYDVLPTTSGNYRYVIISGTTTGGSWTTSGTDSVVEYNLTATGINAGYNTLESGFISSTVQAGGGLGSADSSFKFQLERNSFTSTATEFILALVADTNTSKAAGVINWQEIT